MNISINGIKQCSPQNIKKEIKYNRYLSQEVQDTFQSSTKVINNTAIELNEKKYLTITQKLYQNSLFGKISFGKAGNPENANGIVIGNTNNSQQNSDKNIREITKEEILVKLENVDIPQNTKDSIISFANTQAQILIADKFLSEEKLYKNENFNKQIGRIICTCNNFEQAQGILNLTNKYISEPKLYENENIQETIVNIITACNTPEKSAVAGKFLSAPQFYENPDIQIGYILNAAFAPKNIQCKLDLMDKYVSEPQLYENENLQKIIGMIIYYCNTPEQCTVANEFLSDEKLYKNENLYILIDNILPTCNTPVKAQAKIELMKKYVSEPKLYDNPIITANIGNIVLPCNSMEKAQIKLNLMNKYCSDSKLNENENVQKSIFSIIDSCDTTEQSAIAHKFLSDDKFYKNTNLNKDMFYIIHFSNNPKEIQVKLDLMDKYVSDPQLYNNPNAQKIIGKIIQSSKTKEQAQGLLKLANKYISEPKLYENNNVKKEIADILHFCNSPEEAQIKLDLMDKYIFEPKLNENLNVQEVIGEIISFTNSPQQNIIANKFLSDDKLYNNKNVQKMIGRIISICDSAEQCSIANKFLSDEKFYGNKDIQRELDGIIYSCNTQEETQSQIDLMNKYISEPKLYENINIQNTIGGIIYSKSVENAQIKLDLINKYISEPKLYENPNIKETIGEIIRSCSTMEKAQIKLDLLDKYISEPKLYENSDIQKTVCLIIKSANTQEEAELKLDLINKYISEPQFYENLNIQKTIGDILFSVNTKEQKEIADKFLSEPKLYENANVKETIGLIIKSADTPEKAQVKLDLINKFIVEPKFQEKQNIKETIGWLITFSPQLKSIENKFLSNQNLYQNKDLCKCITNIIETANTDKKESLVLKLLDLIQEGKILPQFASKVITADNPITYEQIIKLNKTVPQALWNKLQNRITDFSVAANLTALYNKRNINEIPIYEKRNIIDELVKNNVNLFEISDDIKKAFPLIPRTQEEYCDILPAMVKSLGIETNSLTEDETKKFNTDINTLASVLKNISDKEFNDLVLSQKYSKENFIKDTIEIIKDLPENEQLKTCNIFGFGLYKNEKTPSGYSISGYPVNSYNSKKFADIINPQTLEIVDDLREKVVAFTQNNTVSSNIPEIEPVLNNILSALPELHTLFDKAQYCSRKFDVMKHSIKVMQKLAQNEDFDTLNASDKKIMFLSALLHDITKNEMTSDSSHPVESSFDAFYITKKFNLTQDEQLKLYNLIRNHEWLKYANKKGLDKKALTKRLQSIAFDFQNDNIFEMAKLFTQAELKSITKDEGMYPAYCEEFSNYSQRIDNYIYELKKTKPILPTTKLPKASEIASKITCVNPDYSTNIKGLYQKDGLIIIKYNEVEDWEAIGLPKGSISKGIKIISTFEDKKIDTGNIKFIAHGLDYENQLINFDSFALPDSDALLSVSYMERPESKYRLFRARGVLLDVDSKYIYGGGETDSGSGCKKDISEFKRNYTFGGERMDDRIFISEVIKVALNLNDEEYIKFIENNQNKSLLEIEPVEAREKLIKQFALINSNTRNGDREYNEMYVSNPKVQGVFAYSPQNEVGEISDFIDNQQQFLKNYAKTNDLPFFVFGD